MKQYIAGDWVKAKEYFDDAMKLDADDGPTKCIYNIMKEEGFKAPPDWAGHRVLNEK